MIFYMIISFLTGMVGIVLVNYSIYRMKGIMNYRNPNKFRQLFGGINADAKTMLKFFKALKKTKDTKLRRQYFEVTFLFIIGIFVFIGAIFYIIKYE